MRRVIATIAVAGFPLALLTSCARAPADNGTVLLDERVALVRGEVQDAAQRELVAPVDGVCAAIVEEDDADVTLAVETRYAGGPATRVEVESLFGSEAVEVAAIDVTRGAALVVSLSAQPVMMQPGVVPLRVVCHGRNARAAGSARAAALQAWARATRVQKPSATLEQRLESLDAAIAALEGTGGDARMAAWGRLVQSKMIYHLASDWRRAYHRARDAERAFAALETPDHRSHARARFEKAAAMLELLNDGTSEDPTPAQARVEARGIFEELASDSTPLSAIHRVRSLNNIGYFCYETNDYPCAVRFFEAAAAAARRIGHRGDELRALQNRAVVSVESGDYVQAVRHFEQVLPLLGKRVRLADRALVLLNAGNAHSNLGNTSRAIEYLLEAQQIARTRDSTLDQGRVAHGLGVAYWHRGDMLQAETFFNEALRLRRIASDSTGAIASLRVAGVFARQRGDTATALALHREAERRSVAPDLRMRVKLELARDHAAAGDPRRAIAECRQALAIEEAQDPVTRVSLEIALAEYLLEQQPAPGAAEEAERLLQRALATSVAKADATLEASARHARAALWTRRGEHAAARRDLEAAIAFILDLYGAHTSPELRAATLSHEQPAFRGYVDLLMREAAAREAGRPFTPSREEENALRVLELVRGAHFDAATLSTMDAATQARIDTLLQQIAGKRVRIAALSDRHTVPEADLARLRLDMSQLRAQADLLRGETPERPGSARLLERVGRPFPAVAPGTVQLSYIFGGRHAYLWVRSAQQLRAIVLAEPAAGIEKALAALDGGAGPRAPARIEPAIAVLSRMLLPPGALDDTSSALEIVAEGRLANVPFAALHLPGSAGRRVVDSHSVRMITSMFDTRGRAAAGARALAFVAVTGDTAPPPSAARVFPALRATHSEAQAIAAMFRGSAGDARVKLLGGRGAEPAAIKALWAGGADVVHFATHALANPQHPTASLLLLPTRSGPEEGAYLTAGQVQEWRGDAGLVFLAACETAAGPARFGPGMSGLPGSFLKAGARGVVATLWPVEDALEREFSLDFYRHLLASRSAAVALAQTQRAWSARRPGMSADEHQRRLLTAWAHVFHARPGAR